MKTWGYGMIWLYFPLILGEIYEDMGWYRTIFLSWFPFLGILVIVGYPTDPTWEYAGETMTTQHPNDGDSTDSTHHPVSVTPPNNGGLRWGLKNVTNNKQTWRFHHISPANMATCWLHMIQPPMEYHGDIMRWYVTRYHQLASTNFNSLADWPEVMISEPDYNEPGDGHH